MKHDLVLIVSQIQRIQEKLRLKISSDSGIPLIFPCINDRSCRSVSIFLFQILPKLCEHFSHAPNCRNDVTNSTPTVQSSSFIDTTYSRNLASPNVSVALADPKPIAVIPPTSPPDIFSEAQKKLENRPKTSIESADTVFASCDDAPLVFGYYCGDNPETQSLKEKCQSYR
uniref:Uncharacterized protein n=1 Tax=Romanomermis culicivorax TaxID=13658 RepID=A0A915HED8_ROMCU